MNAPDLVPTSNSAAARFEQLRADGTQPHAVQNGRYAFFCIAAAPGESEHDFWRRWDAPESGCDNLHTIAGNELVAWMTQRLAWYQSLCTYPSFVSALPACTTLPKIRRGMDSFERAALISELRLAILEAIAADLERAQGDAAAIARVRGYAQQQRDALCLDRAKLQLQLDNITNALKEKDIAARERDEARWSRITIENLRRKPSPASITDWYPATLAGRDVWTNGQMVDLLGEPHLLGWRDRLVFHAYPKVKEKPSADALLQSAVPGAACYLPEAAYDNPKLRRDMKLQGAPLALCAADGQCMFLQIQYVRYFVSKHRNRNVTFRWVGAPSPCAVYADHELAGLVMPIRPMYDLNGEITHLDEIRARLDACNTKAAA